LTALIGTEYQLDESHSGYQEVVKLFNAAMQSHLEA